MIDPAEEQAEARVIMPAPSHAARTLESWPNQAITENAAMHAVSLTACQVMDLGLSTALTR